MLSLRLVMICSALLTLIAAALGLDIVTSPYMSQAQPIAWVFLALTALSMIISMFKRDHGESSNGVTRGLGALALVAAIGVLGYAWATNHWSSEVFGRQLDQIVAQLAGQAGAAFQHRG